jgi:hypothetical protein
MKGAYKDLYHVMDEVITGMRSSQLKMQLRTLKLKVLALKQHEDYVTAKKEEA